MTFDEAFQRLLGHEGGYVNDPADPGGETNWGISKRSYPYVDIAGLTVEGAKAIYLKDFWNAAQLENMPPALAFQLFDFAINSGIGTAIRKLQQAIGAADDGHFGEMSWQALQQMSESDLLLKLNAARLRYMTMLKNWPNHGRGWARRIADNLDYAAEDNDV